MKKLMILATVLFTALAFTPAFATINDQICKDAPNSEFCKQQASGGSQSPTDNAIVGPNGILTEIIEITSIIVGIAAVIVIVIGGIMYSTSAGDSQRAGRGRSAIIYALVGLVVAILARAIVVFVLKRIG